MQRNKNEIAGRGTVLNFFIKLFGNSQAASASAAAAAAASAVDHNMFAAKANFIKP